MTGYDIYKRVLNLCGHLNSGENAVNHQALIARICDIINQICLDLKIPQIKELTDSIDASAKQLDALCYGTAMLLAATESETEKNQLFTQIYNAKRAAVLSESEKIEDVLPSINYGVD